MTLAYVPGKHNAGDVEPALHDDPTGQMLPVTPSVGVLTLAPPVQKYPELQTPKGPVKPGLGQYRPSVQAVHSLSASRLPNCPNVPAGHGTGTSVPTLHQDPAGHGNLVARSVSEQ